jgi:hypothetical protein
MAPFGQASMEAQFCNEVNNALRARDAAKLEDILLIEPEFPPIYHDLIQSLQTSYPKSDPRSEQKLENIIRQSVSETGESEDEEGRPVPSWSQMVLFLTTWMSFIRDVNVDNLLETYERLSDLQSKANSALQHATKGILILPTCVKYAKLFSKVAIGLDKQPELIAHLLPRQSGGEEGRSESLPEKAANILRQGFITCLNDRNTAPNGIKNGHPDGKKIGIYKMANICLKILFQTEKLENCQTIFNNIQNSSPPLHIYPASERVTYLYYLGRFQFATTNFYGAQLCLQAAYDQSPSSPTCIRQRRLILIHLIASNILLGRLPSPSLWTLPEARNLRVRFEPLTTAIRRGDLESFRRITKLDLSYDHASWFAHNRMFYQLANYCEIYVWRSVFRRVFVLTNTLSQERIDAGVAATIDLNAVLAAFLYYERRALKSESMAQADGGPGRRHISMIFHSQEPAASAGYIDADFADTELKPYIRMPDYLEIESICTSLIMQGFLNGWISHKSHRFAIRGAKKARSAVKAGFPNIWQTIKAGSTDQVQGWKTTVGNTGMGGVIELSGARAAGE